MLILPQLTMTSSEMFHAHKKAAQNDKRRIVKLELQTRNALFRLQALIIMMKNELGLLPVSSPPTSVMSSSFQWY